jgi:ubiquinone/menaquinone biosynthesis C-methylase UbiE
VARLRTVQVSDGEDVRRFFDALADTYRDSHGDTRRRLRYRLRVIRRLLRGVGRSCLLEIGCGNGTHLFPLAMDFDRVIGTDLSPRMIAAARIRHVTHPAAARVRLEVHTAECLESVHDESADAVLCVGAFEHMLDQRGVMKEVRRVLKPGGAFVCLAPNGGYIWYAHLAPWLGLHTRHLSTDRFMRHEEWRALLLAANLQAIDVGSWRFVPAGDMPAWAAAMMRLLDRLGRLLRMPALRGGIYVKGVKPLRGSPERRRGAR